MPHNQIKFRGAVYRLADASTTEQVVLANDMLMRVSHELAKFGITPTHAPATESGADEDGGVWATAKQDFEMASGQYFKHDTELLDGVRSALNAAGFSTLHLQKRYGPAMRPTIRMVFGRDFRKDKLVYISVEPAGTQNHARHSQPIVSVVTHVRG